MIIVLEGPDGAGKTTFGEALKNAIAFDYHHDGGASKTVEDCQDRITDLVKAVYDGNNLNQIWDRSTLFSDSIYKRALGKEPMVDRHSVELVVRALAQLPLIVIYCRPPAEVITANAANLKTKAWKGPEYVAQVKANSPKIIREYDENMRRWALCGLTIIHWDYTSMKFDTFVEDLVQEGLGLRRA